MLQTAVIKHRCDLKIPRRALGSSQTACTANWRQAGSAAKDSPSYPWFQLSRLSSPGHWGAAGLPDRAITPAVPSASHWLHGCRHCCPWSIFLVADDLSGPAGFCLFAFIFYFLFLLLLAKNFVFFFVINWDPFTALGGEWQGEFSVASRQGNETISIHITTPVLEKIH